MIKICYIIGQLGRAGAERQLYELVKGINKEIFEPIVISLSQNGYWTKEIKNLKIRVIEIQRRKNKELARLYKLIKLLQVTRPEIVHTYAYSANYYGRIAAIISGVPIIISSERNSVDIGTYKTRNQIYIDRLLSFFTHGIICNSYNASESLGNKYSFNKRKVFTVHNGINFADFSNRTKKFVPKKLGYKVVGTVGRLYPQKNHKLFLDISKIILDEYREKNVKFEIVGDGPLENELKNYSLELGIQDSVVFSGVREDIPNVLKGFDVFLMTSLYEGISNAIIEAMVMGLPVVVTDVGGNRELVIDDMTGFVCPSNDSKALAEKVLRLLNNGKVAVRMGNNGKKKILEEFNSEKMVRKTEEIYLKLFAPQKP